MNKRVELNEIEMTKDLIFFLANIKLFCLAIFLIVQMVANCCNIILKHHILYVFEHLDFKEVKTKIELK